jgi:hypothetical protein
MRVDEPGGDFFTALLGGVLEEGHALEAYEVLRSAVVGAEEVLQVSHVVLGEGAQGKEHIHKEGDATGGLLAVLADRGCAGEEWWWRGGAEKRMLLAQGFGRTCVDICAWIGKVVHQTHGVSSNLQKGGSRPIGIQREGYLDSQAFNRDRCLSLAEKWWWSQGVLYGGDVHI